MDSIKPIRTGADHKVALAEIERLWDAAPGSPEFDRLDVLGTLVDAYERVHVSVAPPDPIEAILFRLEQRGLTRKDLEPLLGTRSRVSEILNRQRSLTLGMIRTLHRELHIPLETLLIDGDSVRAGRPTKRRRATPRKQPGRSHPHRA